MTGCVNGTSLRREAQFVCAHDSEAEEETCARRGTDVCNCLCARVRF